jgi:hypothetical protein
MKIKVFVHLNDMPGAFEVMSEQLTLASESGLIDAAEEVVLCTNGNPGSFDAAKQIMNKEEFPNVTFVHTGDRTNLWEWPTLNLIKQYCDQTDDEFYVCYFHLKGMSRPTDTTAVDWRNYLNYWTIEQWEENIAQLDKGMDTVGVNFAEHEWPHYSGNFWWARASYIRKLEPLTHPDKIEWNKPSKLLLAKRKGAGGGVVLDGGNFRFEHEAWIGSGDPVWAEIHAGPGKKDTGWHYKNNYPREEYATETSTAEN